MDFRGRLKGAATCLAICLLLVLSGCRPDYSDVPVTIVSGQLAESTQQVLADTGREDTAGGHGVIVLSGGVEVPEWNGTDPVYVVNSDAPWFSSEDLARTDAFETYSDLDAFGRCGVAYANVCLELMPTEPRGEIGSVRPSGWHTVRYNDLVSGNYLYNRCHLIGFQLAGENANEKNLITGTRYLNIDGMLPYEDMVDDYVDDNPGSHVLYRVTPVYDGDDLVARGVLMEGWSVEDGGDGVCFNIFAYNVQPGIVIDYATGDSWRADGQDQAVIESGEGESVTFVLNTSSGKFHLPSCQYAESMSEANRLELTQTLQAMLDAGYSPCGVCKPDSAG